MAQIIISALPTGTPQGTDLTPATDPTDTSSAPTGTTKKFVRSAELAYYLEAQGYVVIGAVQLASTTAYTATYANGASGVGATLTNSGAMVPLVVDGVTPALGAVILITDQTPAYENGIYTLTTVGTTLVNWVLTRATNYNMASQIAQYDYIVVDQGATYAGVGFQETGPGPFTIGMTSLIFTPVTPFNGAYLPLSLANGGTYASLTASNGGIFYSNATTGAILAGTATAHQVLLSGSSTTPAWSTATYPATTTINQLLYSSGANVIAGLATLNNGVLVTGTTGIPAMLANSGTAGYVLTANTGAPPSWQAVSAAGAVEQIDTDAGNITPTAGVVTISGGTTGLTTSGSGSTADLTGTLILANGGMSASLTASNGGIFYSTASAGAILAGTATARQMLQSGSSTTPAWSTATYPATTTINQLLYSSSANTIVGLATATTAVLTTAAGVPTWASELSLALGGTNAALTASNGGIFYSTASAGAILAGTATAGQLLMSGASTTPAWSTTTYPATNAVNTLLYASSANVMAALATANDGVLVTSNAGVPSWLANSGTAGYVLTANSGAPPSWQAVSASGSVTSLTGDAGSATPSAGAIIVSGGTTGLTTSGSSHTLSLTGTLILANGGTNAALVASNGGIVYSSATALGILAGTATAGQMLQSGSSTTPAWSTATYPSTTTANDILYSSSANAVGQIATAANGVLVTNNSSVPSFLANSGTAGYVLTANSGAPPSWQAASAGVTSAQVQQAAFNIGTESGSATAYVVTLSPVVASYTDGLVVMFKPIHANTTLSPTLNVNGVGAEPIISHYAINPANGNQVIAVGDLNPAQTAVCIWDAATTAFILQNPYTQVPKGIVSGGYISATDAGTTNAYSGYSSITSTSYTQYPAGSTFIMYSILNTNTGASTIDFGLGTNPAIVTPNGSALVGGEMVATNTYYFIRNSNSQMILLNSSLTVASNKAPTIQKFTSGSGTYTTPTGRVPLYLRVVMVGGGGGGNGGDGGGAGGAGGNTTFGTTLLAANGGAANAGVPGTASLGAAVGIALTGGNGGEGVGIVNAAGGNGGTTAFGGNGAGGAANLTGLNGATNTGSGGGGGGGVSAGGSAGGGPSGGYVDAIITSPTTSYSYAVGTGGTGGLAGTGSVTGGNGGSGLIVVYEYYQ